MNELMKELYVFVSSGYHKELVELAYSNGYAWLGTSKPDYFIQSKYYVFRKTTLPIQPYNISHTNELPVNFNLGTHILLNYPEHKDSITYYLKEQKAPIQSSLQLELFKIQNEIFGTE